MLTAVAQGEVISVLTSGRRLSGGMKVLRLLADYGLVVAFVVMAIFFAVATPDHAFASLE